MYGLIFLYQYFAEDYEAVEPSENSQVWFANQVESSWTTYKAGIRDTETN